MQTLYITHPDCRLHEMGPWHPECPQRLEAVSEALVVAGIKETLSHVQARPASDADLLRVHAPGYLAQIKACAPRTGYAQLDPDTVMNRHTLAAARAAAGAGLVAVDHIMSGEARRAFCSVRPPGHHACSDQAMGFCFFNNLAVAVAYTLEKYGIKKIAIIDFDVHHGNGTEEIFSENPNVLMCSFFQQPLFPDVCAVNNGKNMLNIPLPPGATGTEVRAIVTDIWLPRLVAFQPEMLFISAGFDAHKEDELAQLGLVEADFAWITEQLVNLAECTAGGRIVSFLEGGYNLPALGTSALAHVQALARHPADG